MTCVYVINSTAFYQYRSVLQLDINGDYEGALSGLIVTNMQYYTSISTDIAKARLILVFYYV